MCSLVFEVFIELPRFRGNDVVKRIDVARSTILRWTHQYSPIIEERIRKHIKLTNDSWRVDETYIRINGKNAYLYGAVDSAGNTIEFYVSEHRDKAAARKFFKKALNAKHNQRPKVITTYRYPATEIAIIEETYYGDISCTTGHRMCKYLNNIIEQDHRFIKKKIDPMLGFKTLDSAERTIAGIEIMHMIYKGQIEDIRCVQSEVQFINDIMSEAA